jgi:KaiC/GvpD/RAD55 family RecA-like ATPase
MDKKILKKIDNNELVLIVTSSDRVDEVNYELLKHFMKVKDTYCIYTTFTKPYKVVLKNLNKKKITSSKIFFIDCATPVSSSSEILGNDKAVFCSPQSLTNISIAVKTAMKSISKKKSKILILDTITTLMLYSKKDAVVRFLHSVSGDIRKHKIKSLIFTLDEETDKKIISEISRYCDASVIVK